MEKYEKPQLDVEFFLADVITASDDPPIGCGSADDELPIIPVNEEGDF